MSPTKYIFSSGDGSVFLWIKNKHCPGYCGYKYYYEFIWKTYPLIINPIGFSSFDILEQSSDTVHNASESQSICGSTLCHYYIRTLNIEGGIEI